MWRKFTVALIVMGLCLGATACTHKTEKEMSEDRNRDELGSDLGEVAEEAEGNYTDKESCEDAGGKWGSRDVPNPQPFCNLPTSDAGEECTDSNQCESYCQAEEGAENGSLASGKCYGWQGAICMQTVREGEVQPLLCE